jgi:chromosomal replication initiation ATPase DnaA
MTDQAPDEQPTQTERADLETIRTAAREQVYRDSIPEPFRAATINDLRVIDQNRMHLRKWLQGDSRTLLIFGGRGAGKTHAGYAVLDAASKAGQRVYGSTFDELLDALDPHVATASPISRLAFDADLYLFDDVRALLGPGPDDYQRFAEVLEDRAHAGRRQVITTNETPALLRQRLSDDVWQAMSAGALIVNFTAPYSAR